MSKLPQIPYGSRLQKMTQVQFGGLRHNDNCADGEIYDMLNLSSDHWPCLGTRESREAVGEGWPGAKRFYADGDTYLFAVEGSEQGIYYRNTKTGFQAKIRTVEDAENVWFVKFGARVILMPQKLVINIQYPLIGAWDGDSWPEATALYDGAVSESPINGELKLFVWDGTTWQENGFLLEPIDATATYKNATVTSGTIYGAPASNNTIRIFETIVGFNAAGFREGDGVRIQTTEEPKIDKIAIIREIIPAVEDGEGVLIDINFSDNNFNLGGAESIMTDVTFSRVMPEMDVMFTHDNRFWGAKGREIFASKLGDPRNWNVFDGLSSDSWYLQLSENNDITGGCSFGYPRFLREKGMITVYGAVPSNYQAQEQEVPGVKKGESRSLCECAGLLAYLSPQGVMLHNGESAYLQDQVFGDWPISRMIGSSDGHKMYLYADLGPHPEADGERLLAMFVYDTQKRVWTKEQTYPIEDLWYADGKVLCMQQSGSVPEIVALNRSGAREEMTGVYGSVEFGDFTAGSPERKGLQKISLRLELDEGSYLNVWVKCDGGDWRIAGRASATTKKSINLPVIIRRCDHYRIKIEGAGPWKIYSMTRTQYTGSDMH